MAESATEMMHNPFGAKRPSRGEASKDKQENSQYDVQFIGEMSDGRTLHYGVQGQI